MTFFARNIILILLILSSTYSFSQKYLNFKTHDIDSMIMILRNQVGKERIITLNNLSRSYCFNDEYKLSQQYAEEAMPLAKNLDYREGIAMAYRNLGHINLFLSDYPEALNNLYDAQRIYDELGMAHTVADIYWDIACTHYFANNKEKSVEYALISLHKFRDRLEDGTTVGSLQDTTKVRGGIYLANWELGVDSRELFKIILETYKAAVQNGFSATEIMFITIELGINYFAIGKIDSAFAYLDMALNYPLINKNIVALKYRAYQWKAFIYSAIGEADSSIYYQDIAYQWYSKTGALLWGMYAANNLGYEYQQENNMIMAEKYYKYAEELFNEMTRKNSWYRYDSLKTIIYWGLELYLPIPLSHKKQMIWKTGKWLLYRLYQINIEKNNIDLALKYHIAYSNAADTLNMLIRNHETVELQTRYETEQKEEQIGFLSRENDFATYKLKQSGYFMIGLGVLVIMVIVLATVLIRQNKLREQQNTLLIQQKLFRSQMNPHFLFNSLSSIHNYIIHEESAMAGQYLSKFSKLVRNILDCSVEEYISLEQEISTIENYLELQKIRFPEKFEYSIDIDEMIDTESTSLPPMLLQPFIENSIEHGFKHKEGKGKISISFTSGNDMILIELKDDGIGRKKAQEIQYEQNKGHRSLATAITMERIKLLNKKLKKKITLRIDDLNNGLNTPAGTRVVIEIPA